MKYYYYIPVAGTIMLFFDILEYLTDFINRQIRWDVFVSAICVQATEISLLYLIFKKLISA